MPYISTQHLRPAHVPRPDASIDEILRFAETYSYEDAGGYRAAAAIANSRRHNSLDDLRTCLFFEFRRWRHYGTEPDEEALPYFRELLVSIEAELHNRLGE